MASEQPDLVLRLTALAMRTLGRGSASIRLGYERGFDSGEMMDAIYRNRPSGRGVIGRLADRIYLGQPGCRGLRGRKELLKDAVREALAADRAAGRRPVILDVAAGPATYLVELLAEPGQEDVIAVARDLDEHGLARGRALAGERGLATIRYERADAFDEADLRAVSPAASIVISSGFYELLLDDELVGRSMAIVRRALPADGTFVFTTQVNHPQVKMMALIPNRFGEPWIIRNRPLEVAEQLARAAGFAEVASSFEPTGIFAVSVAR